MTRQTCELMNRDRVTCLAGRSMMIQEVLTECAGMRSGKWSTGPIGGGMTLRAIGSEGTSMEGWLTMARGAIRWDIEFPRCVTLRASQ